MKEEQRNSPRLGLQPEAEQWDSLEISDRLVELYSLESWARDFSLMTAGYRDRLDPEVPENPEVRFNLLTVAILAEAKARVFERKLAGGEVGHVHIGGEVRPHTQAFMAVSARVCAAHGFIVHLRKDVTTTPIWYSSFGTFFEEYHVGANFTASHSPFFKGGWKPLDSRGKQLLHEEQDIVAEVRAVVERREVIKLAPWNLEGHIVHDFDVDEDYVEFLRSIVGEENISKIRDAGSQGFRCSVSTLGGSMKATSERLFKRLGISCEEEGVIRYFLSTEDSHYHGVGATNGENVGPDPGVAVVYRSIGAVEKLLRAEAHLVVLWDPDGDRIKVLASCSAGKASLAARLGLAVEGDEVNGRRVVHFTANQLFLMLSAFRLGVLRESGGLGEHDWFVAISYATTKSIEQLAAAAGLPCVPVRVGFKYMGDLCERIEGNEGSETTFETVTGDRIELGSSPRALILCEESGGATLGGPEILSSRNGNRQMLALREKDGMQIGLLTIALAAQLYEKQQSLVDYYERIVREFSITYLFYRRKDVRLYDESLIGAELEEARVAGFGQRDDVMRFFAGLAEEVQSGGSSLDEVRGEINRRRRGKTAAVPRLQGVKWIGDGVLMEARDFRFLLRPSGTDAVLRYYFEGKELSLIEELERTFVDLEVKDPSSAQSPRRGLQTPGTTTRRRS